MRRFAILVAPVKLKENFITEHVKIIETFPFYDLELYGFSFSNTTENEY